MLDPRTAIPNLIRIAAFFMVLSPGLATARGLSDQAISEWVNELAPRLDKLRAMRKVGLILRDSGKDPREKNRVPFGQPQVADFIDFNLFLRDDLLRFNPQEAAKKEVNDETFVNAIFTTYACDVVFVESAESSKQFMFYWKTEQSIEKRQVEISGENLAAKLPNFLRKVSEVAGYQGFVLDIRKGVILVGLYDKDLTAEQAFVIEDSKEKMQLQEKPSSVLLAQKSKFANFVTYKIAVQKNEQAVIEASSKITVKSATDNKSTD